MRLFLSILLAATVFSGKARSCEEHAQATVIQDKGVVTYKVPPGEAEAAEEYWTPERMRDAEPMGMGVYPDDGSFKVACTEEGRICPDGSSVGRVPPSCEFEPCPGESTAPGAAGGSRDYDNSDSGMVICSQEAKICPDGSAVSRTGPDCEFGPCPDADDTPTSFEVMPGETPAE